MIQHKKLKIEKFCKFKKSLIKKKYEIHCNTINYYEIIHFLYSLFVKGICNPNRVIN